jgi:Na+-transporting methylmalonyl-CoA/oxaloacetate decarboxylase gamma subunit
MSDLETIIFVIAGMAIILISLYVVISMTQDINKTMRKCNEIGTWAKNELERRNDD